MAVAGGQAPFQWRRFMFFDQERIDNQPSCAESIISQLKNFKVFSVFGGRGVLILATQPGFLHFISRQFNDLAITNAFQSEILHLSGLRKHSYIFAVGKDEPSSLPVLKIWNYDKIEVGINPTLTRTLKLELSDFACLTAHENLNYMAIGFKCGKVYLYHKDIARGRHSNHRVLCDVQEEITGLVFSPLAKDVFLYISTPNQLLCYCIVGKERRVFAETRVGCQPAQICPVQIANPEQHVGIASKEGVRFFGPDGSGTTCPTSADGSKIMISYQLDYLFVATQEDTGSSGAKSIDRHSQTVLTVYDSINKFIAFSGSVRNLTHIVAEFGAVFLFTQDGMLLRLVEKDLQSKLDLLFKKNQYELAIKLAKSQRYGESGLIKIFKHYGDHLFSKGDYMNAAEQYRQTIGGLESSYVIRKLLTGAAPPGALACYLEGVHASQRKTATAHHTSLLLNCYIKMKDEAKLKAFISKNENDITFDSEVAVRVLRSSHYADLALGLAKASHQHQQVVAIYVEDLAAQNPKAIDEVLTWIEEKLDPATANWAIRRYGQEFMSYSPERTTNLLKKLLSLKAEQTPRTAAAGIFSFGDPQQSGSSSLSQTQQQQGPSFHLFNGRPGPLMNFLESIVERTPEAPPSVYNALIDVYVQQWAAAGSANDKANQQRFETKILDVLKTKFNQADQSGQAESRTLLLMFDSYKFYPGVEFMLERLGCYAQLMSNLADRGQFEDLSQLVERQDDEGMRLQLLGTLAGSEKGLDLIPKTVQGFLGKGRASDTADQADGERRNSQQKHSSKTHRHVLAPEIIDALCRPGSIQSANESVDVPFEYVRDYLLNELVQVDEEADRNVDIANRTRTEAVDLRAKLATLREQATSFQETRCRSCNFKLELPTVHFMCQHSYHSNCLDYGDPDCCPKCSKEQKEILEQIKSFDEMRARPSTSIQELARAPDLFATLGDLLAKGLLSSQH